ncbi:Protein CBG21696 [Caenorhabditis briggsae]|uniref:Protein CBG21696 n=3 Tax=Caenorhabditis briggsae TaxID=6238 RepID=A8Y0Q1_CAEBR|nr:Protein CBG21696 [Caenorhabditis briggsae]ULT94127.1 hypothetical protein L3Y34_003534 [Caenorhabditis briggsae]CAP38471.1 Protein CBG21696 [Caenorhabditis briggsae]
MDFLNEFDPSSDDESTPKTRKNYPMFSPNLNDKFWYRDVSKENQTATAITEIDLFRVADFYSNGDYEAAKQILTDLRENTKNNRTHEIMLIDSLLQCTKEGGLCQSETDYCLRLLSEYESLLVDSGDQVQFLRTKASILAKFDKNIEFRNTMALLCHLCGSFDNWQLFESGAKFFNDVELYGLKMKMKKVLHYEIDHSRGFVKEKLEKKLKKIEEEEQYLAGKLQQDDIDSILSSLNSNKDVISPESATSFVFRAHDSRSKNKLIPVADHPSVISDFFHRFPFLS